MRLSVNRKLVLGYTLVILLSSVATIQFSFSQLDRVVSQSGIAMDNTQANREKVHVFERSVSELQKELLGMQASRQLERLPGVRQRLQQLRAQLGALRTGAEEPEFGLALARMERAIGNEISALDGQIAGLESGAVKRGEFWDDQTLSEIVTNLDMTNELRAIQQYYANQMSRERRGIEAIRQNAVTILLIIFLVSVVVAALVGMATARTITRQIGDGSTHIRSVSDSLAETTERESTLSSSQASEIRAASTTLNGMAAASREIARHTQEMTRRAGDSAERVLHLQELAQRVEHVNTVVEEIAQQINILSLNASIEASRAGEQGKGFAAVALEIRKLAENTKNSTAGIRTLAENIQDGANTARDAIERMVTLVQDMSARIAEQDSATTDITAAMAKGDNGMQASVESTRVTQKSAEELRRLAHALQAMI